MKDTLRYLKPEEVARLESLELVARLVVEGFLMGLHRSPYHGFSAEFTDHRPYMPGDTLTAALDTDVSNGSLTLNVDGSYTYTHDDSENLSDSFTYTVFDGVNTSAPATVTLTITPVNDNTPVANADSGTVGEGGRANGRARG